MKTSISCLMSRGPDARASVIGDINSMSVLLRNIQEVGEEFAV
jgi:hypothetical protein